MELSTMRIIRLVVFACMFASSFYALSCIDYAKFCNIRQRQKLYLLLFLLSLCLGWISTECILSLTIYGGL